MSNGGQNAVDNKRKDLQERRFLADAAFKQFRENAFASTMPPREALNEVLSRVFHHSTVEFGSFPQSGLPYHLVKNRETTLPA